MILLRTLRADYARYTRDDDDLEALERDVSEESGWKLVHGDVFRPPRHLEVLAALIGTGVQLALLALSTILVTIAGTFALPWQLDALRDGEQSNVTFLPGLSRWREGGRSSVSQVHDASGLSIWAFHPEPSEASLLVFWLIKRCVQCHQNVWCSWEIAAQQNSSAAKCIQWLSQSVPRCFCVAGDVLRVACLQGRSLRSVGPS